MPWFLKAFSKKKVLAIFRQIWRHVFAEIYKQISGLVLAAEYDENLATGFDKGQWVYKQFISKYDTWSEWKWVVQITIDIAHLELIKQGAIPKALETLDTWRKN